MKHEAFERFLEKAKPQADQTKYERHPSQQVLEAYVYGQLDGLILSRVSVHVATCGKCSQEVSTLRQEADRLESSLAAYLDREASIEPLYAQTPKTSIQRWHQVVDRVAEWVLRDAPGSLVRLAAAAAAAAIVVAAANLALDRWMVPPVMRPGGSRRPMIAWPVRDLQAPDSPTTPNTSPAAMSKETPSTALRMPRRVSKAIFRSRIFSSGSFIISVSG